MAGYNKHIAFLELARESGLLEKLDLSGVVSWVEELLYQKAEVKAVAPENVMTLENMKVS